jgi:hypothetical protein
VHRAKTCFLKTCLDCPLELQEEADAVTQSRTFVIPTSCTDPGEQFWDAWDPKTGCLTKDWPVNFPNTCPV